MKQPSRRTSARKSTSPWYTNLNTWVGIIIGAAILGTVLIIALTLLLVLQNQDSMEEAITAATQTPGSVAWQTPLPGGGGSMSGPLIEPWESNERFTILVMGLDKRPGEQGTGFRTDSLILVSIDPATHSLGMLSIPRDLYVVIPGYDQNGERHRINEALPRGELQQVGYGPYLAMQTVQLNFGIYVHEYLAVDFNTFVSIIDEIGGVDVEVSETIYDPYYPDQAYGYDPFYIEVGWQHMDGAVALKYARTRHTTSDVDRARRQQQVIYAVRDKILNVGLWPQLVSKAPALWNDLSAGIQTGLDFNTTLQLALYIKDIPGENIHSSVLDANYVSDWTTPLGEMVLVPNQSALADLMVQVFGSTYNQ
jgi:LCP family protein required for cell wall assembly